MMATSDSWVAIVKTVVHPASLRHQYWCSRLVGVSGDYQSIVCNESGKSTALLLWCGKLNYLGNCILPNYIAVNHMPPEMILLHVDVRL